jgi:hypothetical protein
MRKRKLMIPFFAFLAACGPVPPLPAGGGQQAKDHSWKSRNLPVHGRYTRLPVEVFIDNRLSAEQFTAIENAVKTWNAAVSTELVRLVGAIPSPALAQDSTPYTLLNDDTIGIWLANDWSWMKNAEGAAGTTLWCFGESNNEIAASDIYLNADHATLAKFPFGAPPEDSTYVDTESLVLHELGHLLGLSHTSSEWDPDSVMHPVLLPVARRKLSEKDVALVRALYRDEWDPRLAWFRDSVHAADARPPCGSSS